MTIDTQYRGRIARLTVKHPVPVHVDVEMAVSALHPMGEMHVFQVHRLGKLSQIAVPDSVVFQIEQVSLAVVFENCAEYPAMAVVVGELSMFHLRVQFRDMIEKIFVAPESTGSGCFGIAHG